MSPTRHAPSSWGVIHPSTSCCLMDLPPGLTLGDDGVLSGTPTSGGTFNFTVQATDADNTTVSQAYVLTVTGGIVVPKFHLAVEKFGAGTGTVAGSGIDCWHYLRRHCRRGHHGHVDGDTGRRQRVHRLERRLVQAPAIAW